MRHLPSDFFKKIGWVVFAFLLNNKRTNAGSRYSQELIVIRHNWITIIIVIVIIRLFILYFIFKLPFSIFLSVRFSFTFFSYMFLLYSVYDFIINKWLSYVSRGGTFPSWDVTYLFINYKIVPVISFNNCYSSEKSTDFDNFW